MIKKIVSVVLLLGYTLSFQYAVHMPINLPYYEVLKITTEEKYDKFADTRFIYDLQYNREQRRIQAEIEASYKPEYECTMWAKPWMNWERIELAFKLTEYEKHILACIIKLEADDQSKECQLAVGSVVLNRLKQHYNGQNTLHEVIYAKGQFNPAHRIEHTTPTKMQIEVVEELCWYGVTIPENVLYFYYKRFSRWGRPYKRIGTECFSYG